MIKKEIFMETYVRMKLQGKRAQSSVPLTCSRKGWNRSPQFGEGLLELCKGFLVEDQHILSL